jgi:YfiH family protein
MPICLSKQLNLGRFETRTERPDFPFHQVTQVHGNDIVHLNEIPCEADGIIVNWTDYKNPLAIKTADCLPVVIEGESGVVFLHAGWKGLANGILQQSEIKSIQPLTAYIGPSIQSCCFEVSQDFRENFPKSSFFHEKKEKLFFNLQAEAEKRLKDLHPHLTITISHDCTFCHPMYYSYRRDKTTQRNWNIYIKGS